MIEKIHKFAAKIVELKSDFERRAEKPFIKKSFHAGTILFINAFLNYSELPLSDSYCN